MSGYSIPKAKAKPENPIVVRYREQLTPEEIENALGWAAEGLTITLIAQRLKFANGFAFQYFRASHPLFDTLFKSACQAGMHKLADSVIEIIDQYTDPQAARIKIDAIKWLLAKRMPEVYGEKIDVSINQTISVKSNIEAAESRIAKLVVESQPMMNEVTKLVE